MEAYCSESTYVNMECVVMQFGYICVWHTLAGLSVRFTARTAYRCHMYIVKHHHQL